LRGASQVRLGRPSQLGASACGPKEEDYTAKIAATRAAKDQSFKADPDSPIPADKRATLIPLAYFPIDETYAVPASLEPAAERTRMQVPTSTGKMREIEKVGTLKFSLKGQSLRLTAFLDLESREANRLFVPFSDLTSGAETYPAGRYMELDPTPDRHLRRRLQHRLSPLLLLQPRVRLPVPAEGEPPRSADSRRREDAKGRFEHPMIRIRDRGSGSREQQGLRTCRRSCSTSTA
jgi:hypothetical protein